MPHNCALAGPDDHCSARAGNPDSDQGSGCEKASCMQSEVRAKRRAIVFSAILLLQVVVLMAMLEQGLDSGIGTRQLLGKLRSLSTDISVRQVPALVMLGAAAGVFSGMLGLGGGVLKVAGLLLLFKLDIFFARAVSLATMFFATASAIRPYMKSGLVAWPIIRQMLPAAVVGLAVGVLLATQLREATLACVFGFFVLFLGFYTLAMVFDDPRECIHKEDLSGGRYQGYHVYLSRGIGVCHGFICGLLGISGGVVAVPMQQLLLNAPTRVAIANTLVVSALCSGVGSVAVITIGVGRGDFSLEHILFAVMCVGVGAVFGAQLGVYIGTKTRTEYLKLLFVIISFGAGISLLM